MAVDGGAVEELTDVVEVAAARQLRGSPLLPGDKSISHRALLLGLLAPGRTRILGSSDGADVRSTAGIVRALGADVGERVDGGGRPTLVVESPGIEGLRRPSATLDCGNSGTSLRLFAGILAGQPFEATLDGDASLRSRPVARIIEPLRAMGAALGGRRHDTLPPITIRGRPDLTAIDWIPSVPSAQVKSAILLAGLRASGTTRVHELVATRDHTERMLRRRGVRVAVADDPSGGRIVEIEGGQSVTACDELVPGDASAAAFWLVAGSIHADAELRLPGVGVNPGRRAVIDLLRAMGADIDEVPHRAEEDAEPTADLVVRSASLRGIDVHPPLVAGAIDEIPVLCLAATQARGVTRFRGAGELRHKESDRLAGIVAGLSALGADIAVEGDDIVVAGPRILRGAELDGRGDHRLVMTFAVAGLIAAGRTVVRDAGSAGISDPRFLAELERIRT